MQFLFEFEHALHLVSFSILRYFRFSFTCNFFRRTDLFVQLYNAHRKCRCFFFFFFSFSFASSFSSPHKMKYCHFGAIFLFFALPLTLTKAFAAHINSCTNGSIRCHRKPELFCLFLHCIHKFQTHIQLRFIYPNIWLTQVSSTHTHTHAHPPIHSSIHPSTSLMAKSKILILWISYGCCVCIIQMAPHACRFTSL